MTSGPRAIAIGLVGRSPSPVYYLLGAPEFIQVGALTIFDFVL